jgi:hypothetical protein
VNWLLDTNVVSELCKAGAQRADRPVLAWARARRPDTLYLSIISVLEIEIGIRRVEYKDAAQGQLLRRWLDEQLLPTFGDRILTIDLPVVRRCSALHVPNPAPVRDALIAATAITHGLTIATRNVGDFESSGAMTVNPWLAG